MDFAGLKHRGIPNLADLKHRLAVGQVGEKVPYEECKGRWARELRVREWVDLSLRT